MRIALIFLAAALVVIVTFSASAETPVPEAYSDHPDPFESPSFVYFPTHEEVVTTLGKYEGHPWVRLHALGQSTGGRPVWVAEVADPGSPVPMEQRVVTFLFTQQHGNEPAGTPAALELLHEIATGGEAARFLQNQIVLLLPMANPDGASANQRANADGHDINRDHISLETPEAVILHEVLNRWDVHVAVDHHEYGGTGLGNPVPVRLYDYDLTTLYPNHGNVREPTSAISQRLMYDGIWPAAEAAGYTANEYGEQTVAGVPVQYVAGGPDPGIMRNHLGLHNAAGLLVETRVDAFDNPFQDAARRTAIHANVMHAALAYVHDHASEFIDAKRESERLAMEDSARRYVEGTLEGPLAAAYRVPTDTSVDAVLARHALPVGVAAGQDTIHNLIHALQGHAAAALHPASSRALVEGAEPTDPVPWPGAPAAELGAPAATPGPAFALLLLAVLGMAAAQKRMR